MYTDIPELKRCCFCVPLRYGIIVWMYIKLISNILLLMSAIEALVYGILYPNEFTIDVLIIISISIFISVVGFIFNTSLIVGAHMKQHKVMRVYYYYSVVVIIIKIIIFLIAIGWAVYGLPPTLNGLSSFNTFHVIRIVAGYLMALFLLIILQFYLTLLIRSEIHKLKNNVRCKFVNAPAPADLLDDADACADKNRTEKAKYDRLDDITVYNA